MSNLIEIETRAAQWLAREDAGALDAAAQTALNDWLEADLSHRIAWLRLRRAWQEAGELSALRDADSAGRALPFAWFAWRRPQWLSPGYWTRPAWGMALATVLMAVSLAWLALPYLGLQRGAAAASFAAGAKNLQLVALADGSRVTLEPESKVRVAVSKRERRVWLEAGTAFFDVAKDPAHPFVVSAGNKRITVLGTKFAVYLEGDKTRVVVLEGRVKVEDADGEVGPAAVMTHGQVALAEGSSMLIQQKPDQDISNSLSWRTGRLVFDREKVADIAAEFNKYNSTKIVVAGSIAAQEMSGSFDPHNAQGFVNLLAAGYPISVRIDGDSISVHDR